MQTSLTLNIELKNRQFYSQALEETVVDFLKWYGLTRHIVLSTFNPKSLQRLHYMYPDLQTALIISKRRYLKKAIIPYAQALGITALHIKYNLLTPGVVTAVHQAGLDLRVFTVNSSRRMKLCLNSHCDGMFTDVPAKALHFRDVYAARYYSRQS